MEAFLSVSRKRSTLQGVGVEFPMFLVLLLAGAMSARSADADEPVPVLARADLVRRRSPHTGAWRLAPFIHSHGTKTTFWNQFKTTSG